MVLGFGKKAPPVVEGRDVSPASDPQQIHEKSGVAAAGTDFEKVTATGHQPTEEDANHELKFLKKLHRWDPNLDNTLAEDIDRATADHDATAELELINLIENDSPYPEVRAAVRPYDEDHPASTIRSWTIGMVLVTLGSAMNMLFSMRNPSIIISSFVAQLIAYPLGTGWDKIMPKFMCNGKFNYKEHTLITIMANVSFGGGAAYSTDTLIAMKGAPFYGIDFGWGFQLLLTLTTQMVGYGLAGLLRKFLVWPASMIWPQNFVNTSLFYALHDHSPTDPAKANGWSIGRYRYFLYVWAGAFVWYWFPGWIFQALSYFAFATWISPTNVVVNQLFGYSSGIGLIPVTFDWTQITGFTYSPLMFPWHGIANTVIGVVIFFMILACGLHYSNWAYSLYLPMSTSGAYDNTASTYNVSKILSPEHTLDLEAYNAYSPLFLSITFAITYGLSFATMLAVITHTSLFHGTEIWTRAKLSLGEEPDVHTKMMRKYKEVPAWWYAGLGALFFALSMVTCLVWDTKLTWWALILAFIIATVFAVPIGMVQAITNVQIGLNVITEFIIGYMLPGRPIAMMLFKTYGYITMLQALYFCQDLKMGHYMKLPPRVMFTGQVGATVWSCIVQIAVMNWAFGSIKDICTSDQASHFTCPGGRVFFNASIIWGLIGPQRIFSSGQLYNGMMYFFIAGLLGPPLFYLLARMFPKSNFRYVNMPVIFGGSGQIPPAQTINYTSWAIVGYIFNKYIKNKYRGWWSHYNYITSAALDTGLALSTIIIFLTLELTLQTPPVWWGNNVIANTLDWNNTAIARVLPEGQTFGPTKW